MIPYLLVFIFTIFFTHLADKYYNEKILFCIFSVIALVPPILLAGLRDETIGTDIQVYVIRTFAMAGEYGNMGDFLSDSNIDIVFTLLMYFSNTFFGSVNGALIVIAAFILICVYVSMMKMRLYFPMSYAMFIYLFSFYNTSLNLMRQNMAMAVCLLMFVFFIRKEYVKSTFAGVVAFLCHSSSVFFLIPIILYNFFCQQNRQWEKTRKCVIIYCTLLPLIFLFFDSLLDFFIGIGVFAEKYAMYSTLNKEGGTVVNTLFVLTYVIFIFVTFRFLLRNKRSKNNLYAFIITYSTLVVSLLSAISMWAGRLSLYFQIITVWVFPVLIYNLPYRKIAVYKKLFTVLIVFYWWYTYIFNNANETYPYVSKILGI